MHELGQLHPKVSAACPLYFDKLLATHLTSELSNSFGKLCVCVKHQAAVHANDILESELRHPSRIS